MARYTPDQLKIKAEEKRKAAQIRAEKQEKTRLATLTKIHIRVGLNIAIIFVSRKAYEGIYRKAFVFEERLEENKLVIDYESKSGKVQGQMILNNLI